MSLSTLFKFRPVSTLTDEIPNIFPAIAILQSEFVAIDIVQIYTKILTDVAERCSGLSSDQEALLWDNCLMSAGDGLIELLATAMADKKDLFLVYDKAVEVVRVATAAEAQKIKSDYETGAESDSGLYVSFKNYSRTDMVRLYSGLEFLTVNALNKTMQLSQAIQIKISDLRASVATGDSEMARAQALAIATGLGCGRDVLLDAKDAIETSKPDLESVKQSITFLDAKRSFYLGLPAAYINGEQTSGLGATGEVDTKAIERGLKSYYFSIVKPVFEALFDVSLTYKSQDYRQLSSALEAMKTFELTGEEYLSKENKKAIVEGLLEIDPDDNDTVEAAPIDVTPPVPTTTIPPKPKEATA